MGRAVRCSLACDRGWRGVAPSVAVFQCSFSLGTSVSEVNAALYVMCESLQNGGCAGWAGRGEEKVSVRAVNTSTVTSFS